MVEAMASAFRRLSSFNSKDAKYNFFFIFLQPTAHGGWEYPEWMGYSLFICCDLVLVAGARPHGGSSLNTVCSEIEIEYRNFNFSKHYLKSHSQIEIC